MKHIVAGKRLFSSHLAILPAVMIAFALFAGNADRAVWAAQTTTPESATEITVYKTASCGCCTKWVEHLQANGFEVQVETVAETGSIRSNLAVPERLGSCHTAVVGDYWVEGHVPADLIRNLLEEKPTNIAGITVPGMVPGSPGMESPQPRKYQVLSVDDKGQVAVYAERDGDSQH